MNTNKEFLVLALSFILLSLYSSPSIAKFMIEPRVQSINGQFDVGSIDGKFTGQSMGLNLGYIGDNIMAGISLEKGDYKYDSNLSADSYKDYKGGGVGSYLAFHFWNRYRVITSYLNSTLEPEDNDSLRYFGQYASLGIGYRVWSGLLLNYEFFKNQFTQLEDDSSGKTTGLDSNIKTQGSHLYLSYVLVF